MMFDARFIFLLLTGFMLAILVAVAVSTLKKNRKQKLEEPKHRMLEDD
ncbi:MAG: cbb3-type cytochrome c oxidase subunit 3 [Desulfuromonadaceae bacterium]